MLRWLPELLAIRQTNDVVSETSDAIDVLREPRSTLQHRLKAVIADHTSDRLTESRAVRVLAHEVASFVGQSGNPARSADRRSLVRFQQIVHGSSLAHWQSNDEDAVRWHVSTSAIWR